MKQDNAFSLPAKPAAVSLNGLCVDDFPISNSLGLPEFF